MGRFAAVPLLLVALSVAACSPAARPVSNPISSGKPTVNQGYVDSHRRMVAALQRFVAESPVVREAVGDVSRLRGEDVALSQPIPVTRVIRFAHEDKVVYGVWVTYPNGSATYLSAPGDAPLNYPQNYFARMDAMYGAKPMRDKDKAAFLRQFTKDWDEGNYEARDLRSAQAGSAIVVEVRDALQLIAAEDFAFTDVVWTYDPVADRVLSMTLGDEEEY